MSVYCEPGTLLNILFNPHKIFIREISLPNSDKQTQEVKYCVAHRSLSSPARNLPRAHISPLNCTLRIYSVGSWIFRLCSILCKIVWWLTGFFWCFLRKIVAHPEFISPWKLLFPIFSSIKELHVFAVLYLPTFGTWNCTLPSPTSMLIDWLKQDSISSALCNWALFSGHSFRSSIKKKRQILKPYLFLSE